MINRTDFNELTRSIHRESYFDFFRDFWPMICGEPLIENWHLEYLCSLLTDMGHRIAARKPKQHDLVINISPGESKSTLATQLFPVWLWTLDPAIRIISGSYSKELSISHAVKSRDCIVSPEFRNLYGHLFELKRDVDNKSHYANNAGGERIAVSVGSTLTGFHANVLIVDDPLNPEQAISDAKRDSANRWMDKTLSSRKIDERLTPTILIMQRLHEGDCTANFLEKHPEALHVCLPASNEYEIKPPELGKHYSNGLMNPQRKPRKVLEEKARTLGTRDYAGQYGQTPQPLDGDIIKREYLQIIGRGDMPKTKRRIDFVADTAYTAKQSNDPSAILAYTVINHDLYILNYWEGRKQFSDLIRVFKSFVKENGRSSSVIHIEPKASGKSIVQYLKKETALNVREYKMPEGDKLARISSCEPKLEGGRVFLIRGPWNESFIQQCLTFPNAKHDEAVDCLAMAITQGLIRPGRIAQPVRRAVFISNSGDVQRFKFS